MNHELIGELRRWLIGEGFADGMTVLVRAENGVVQVHIMAVELGRLGMLLAALSDSTELQHPRSLSRRLALGDNDGADGQWQIRVDCRSAPAQQRDRLLRPDQAARQRRAPEILARIT